jgi:hypothetical protein
MPTEKQFEESRLNGATMTDDASARLDPNDYSTQRSTSGQGPVPAEGKLNAAASSASDATARPDPRDSQTRRSLSVQDKRQLLANTVALPAERTEEFLELLNDYRHSLQPVGFLEERVVETITACDWYRRRYWGLSMAKIAHATAIQEQASDDFTNAIHQEIGGMQTAIAVSKLADTGRTLEFFRRCDSGYSREHRHARKELKELQTDRLKRERLERLDRPPDFDIESCFVRTYDPPEEAKKIDERTQPASHASGFPPEIQSWEPWSPNDEAIAEPLLEGADTAPSVSAGNHTVEKSIQQDVQVDAQSVVVSVLQQPAPVVATEKITEQTEPKEILVGTEEPFQPPSHRARVPLLISCRGNIADQHPKGTP